jgi:hypothetical protein
MCTDFQGMFSNTVTGQNSTKDSVNEQGWFQLCSMHWLLHKLTSASPASATAGLFHWLGQRSHIGGSGDSFARWCVPACTYPLGA